MNAIRDLTKDEEAELAALNNAVKNAIAKRREWLDAKMVEASSLKIGDDIYDVNRGCRLGTVRKMYRYWRDKDEGVRDTRLSVEYEFEVYDKCYSNTSSRPELWYGSRQDAERVARQRADFLARSN